VRSKTSNLLVILITVLLSFVAIWYALRLNFSYEFEEFFPDENAELSLYNEFRNKFEHDHEFVLIGIENSKGIFNKDFLTKVDSLTKILTSTEDIKQVISPTNLTELMLGGIIPRKSLVLNFRNPDRYKDDSTKIYSSGEYIGSVFPINAKSVSLYLKTSEKLSKSKSDTLAKKIQIAISNFKFEKTHFVGRIVAQDAYLKKLQREFFMFLIISFLIVLFFLIIAFRSFNGVIVPVIIIVLSILWTLGFMGVTGKSIDVMTVMLPTMIFITGMSDVVHYLARYYEERNKTTDHYEINKSIRKDVGFPTFLTLVSTLVGFLSLLFSSIKPVKDFGIYTSFGITLAFILTYTVLPSILFFFPPKKIYHQFSESNSTYGKMRNTLFWIFRNQRKIVIVAILLCFASFVGIYKIKINHILLEDLKDKEPVKKDFVFFDQNYSGVRPFELWVKIKNPNKKIWDYEIISEISKIDNYLKKTYGTGFLISPAQMCYSLNKSLYEGDPAQLKLPDKDDFQTIITYIRDNKNNKDIKRIISPDGKSCRISGKIPDIGSRAVELRNEKLREFISKNIDETLIDVQMTGAAELLDSSNKYMVDNMLQGFYFSIFIIGALTWFLHRSLKMVLVFMLPNLIPLIAIGGLMGFMGIELKTATSLVFSIAFGIATDDTIHFISRFKIELDYGKSVLYAFKRTYFETGRPILITGFILIGGFMSLMTSDFQSVFYFGFLICATLIVAVVADMLLLPVLLIWIMGGNKKKKISI
jgi:predicted RND superfamily exporter protein